MMAENIFYDVAHNASAIEKLSKDLYSIYNKKPIGLLILKNDKLTKKLLTFLSNEFEELIISTIDSKDILQKDEILHNNQLKQFRFIDNITEALSEMKSVHYNGPKVIFGSHYIAKELYKFFDFSFDNGTI